MTRIRKKIYIKKKKKRKRKARIKKKRTRTEFKDNITEERIKTKVVKSNRRD